MWKEKLKSGKVRYLERYTDPMTGRVRRVSVTIKPTGRKSDDRAAKTALSEKVARLTRVSTDPEMITFQELTEKRIAYQLQNDKIQTATSSGYYMHTLVRLIGGDTLVHKLSAPYVAEHFSADKPDPCRYNERLKHFKALMRWAFRADLVADVSYLDKLQRRKEPPVREKDKYKYLEHDEIQKLLDGMKVERWRLLTKFLILSGLRIGEAIALDDRDVDLDSRLIHVTKTYAHAPNVISSTKTDTSTRDVYIQDELLECCRQIKAYARKDQMMYGYRSNIFLPDTNRESYISYDVYAKYFRENTEAILGRRLSPHCLRHTHTAMLAEAGIPLEDISRRLGHADSKITKEVYLHVTEKMQEKAHERIRKVQIISESAP
ncbi:MAG: tyrosine-type recombinase/integrase [Bilifractor sp.]|jgi:integrase